ncbi:MAG TPA: aldo/keto reductase, partial [Planctomycetota bacterium]|nr:aldo/keto reductase [Planctomycetota bacterium]
HRFDPDTPLLETARAMDDLIGAGKTLYWGTSQWPAERLAEVVALCQTHGLHAPISNQPLYNLFDRGIEAEVLPTSERCGLGQLVFSPLAQGVLTGKYLPEQKPPKGSRGADARLGQFVERYLQPQRLLQAQQLVQLAKAQGCTAGQLALRFCLRDPRLTAVIVGARSEAQLLESIAAAELQPGPEVLAELERLFPV